MIRGTWGTSFAAVDEHNELLGQIALTPHAEYGWLVGMLVDERARGRGIGSAMLDTITEWARGRGIDAIRLFVFPHNEAGLALYRKAGFVETERFVDDVERQTGEVWDTILMTKTL